MAPESRPIIEHTQRPVKHGGVVEGDTLRQLSTSPFEEFRISSHTHHLAEVKLLAPCEPRKVLAIGLNYRTHLGQREAPKRPEPFWKGTNCIVGPGERIILPRDAGRVEEEGELVVVMGKRCKHVAPDRALEYVLGYTCGNDVSARQWQRGDLQWWRAKSSDTFGPIGPFIVTGLDPSRLYLRVRVNGKEVQASSTGELLYDVPTVISAISQVVTLETGDLIFTGTPGQPAELHPGDIVEVEISDIGVLLNPVQAEE
ncbi:MAG: fumarylacetoacetate hydrolase family protein [Chloroflexi bacterium]|nr:fumarylacetoacetate hydrolase family protein [Chloroflexota bacterium]